ncbi:MAG: VOC family protein [Armatimonadetes bacterium]|jgi:lactoylglutathione lyase|nr:VOC family protein [Armatimonadota bacterium]
MADFQPRFLHCRIRVRDIDRSVKFYTELFGFVKVRDHTSPAGNKLAFLELPGNNTQIELCFQPDSPDFDFPEDIFHFAISVPDLHEFRKRWEPEGVEFWPEDGPVNDSFYFVDDPDGYEIEVMKIG